jgi:hypothetical protein
MFYLKLLTFFVLNSFQDNEVTPYHLLKVSSEAFEELCLCVHMSVFC